MPNYPNTSLKQVIENIIYENDPYGKFKFSDKLDTSGFEHIIIIGNDNRKTCTNSIWIDSYNWIYGLSNTSLHYKKPSIESNNPVGPVLAACSGNALLFKVILKTQQSNLLSSGIPCMILNLVISRRFLQNH